MTKTAAPKRQSFAHRLGVRLAFAFAISLLPLGLISAFQSGNLIEEARARSMAALLGETMLSAGPEAQLIRGARVAARTLAATIPDLLDDPAGCSKALRRLLDQSAGAYSFVVFVPLSGDARCTSSGTPLDLSESDRLKQVILTGAPDTVVIRNGTASGRSVLAFGHPVLDEGGAVTGYVSISLPHSMLAWAHSPQTDQRLLAQAEPITLSTFDINGAVLTSSLGVDKAAAHLPRDVALADLATNAARTFRAPSNDGKDSIFAIFPLVDGTIFAIGSWPSIVAGDVFSMWLSPYFMPALMWLASVLVAMLASERLVTRHIRTLRRSITSFANGNHRTDDLDLHDASVELRDVADAYLKMTSTILHNEASLENMVHQREVLLREVHHRVKNNLQLISSIINMQMRQSHNPGARTLMKGLQDRVMSLATIHRGLYQTSGLADVRADELLSDIVRQILKMSTGPGRVFNVTTHFDDLRLIPDQAVPLSLLLTEALTNALKYARTNGPGLRHIDVSLRRHGISDAILLVSNSVGSAPIPPPADPGTGLGTRLLSAFGQQLGAESVTTQEDGLYQLSVRFPLRSLAEAEASSDQVDLPTEPGPDHASDQTPDKTPDQTSAPDTAAHPA